MIELNIEKILKKVRDSYAMVSHLPNSKDLRILLNYNKNNVIELSESDDDNENDDKESSRPSIDESSKDILSHN